MRTGLGSRACCALRAAAFGVVVLAFPPLLVPDTPAQQLEPRAYSPNPIGANFLVVGYGYQAGGVLSDPSSPISDVSAKVFSCSLGYAHTFGLFGRSATIALTVPYVWGSVEGKVFEAQRSVTRAGLGDTTLKVTVNILGGPALTPREFAAHPPSSTLGASLTVVGPTGEYDASKLVNIGMNRWAFKPELGFVWPVGKWFLEVFGGAWLFTDNDEYFGGVRRSQDPLASIQAHASYTFQKRMWVAIDATYYSGGQTALNGVARADRQSNSRLGATYALPIGAQQSIKFVASRGAATRVGQNFTTLAVAYQFLWFDQRRAP